MVDLGQVCLDSIVQRIMIIQKYQLILVQLLFLDGLLSTTAQDTIPLSSSRIVCRVIFLAL